MKTLLSKGLFVISIGIIGLSVYGYTMFAKHAPTIYVTEAKETLSKNENSLGASPAKLIAVDTSKGTTSETIPTYTYTQVAEHGGEASCYSVLKDAVYDLTMFIAMHPGGKGPILHICGKDGTEVFMNKHHGEEKYMKVLSRFRIGTLKAQ